MKEAVENIKAEQIQDVSSALYEQYYGKKVNQ